MLGDKIKALRIKNQFTQKQLADKLGLAQSTIGMIESGKRDVSFDILIKIADFFNVSTDFLTRKSAKAIIEDKLEKLNATFEDLSNKTKIPIEFFKKLDSIIPDDGDYKKMQLIAHALNIDSADLVNALARQEPPIIKEKTNLYETSEFKTPEAAIQFILKQPAIMGFGGFDINKMSDDEIIEFANELLNQLKLLSYKYKK